jgi:tetratricopeptide (TPR) repeat protein
LLGAAETADLILEEGQAATGYERTVAATLSLAFQRLSPAAARLLRVCAFAAPGPLPERCFAEAREELPEELQSAAAIPLSWNRAAGELRQFGIAQRVGVALFDAPKAGQHAELALDLHRLTQRVARSLAASEDGRTFQRMLLRSWRGNPKLSADWNRCAALVPHAIYIDQFYSAKWFAKKEYGWLLHNVGTYLLFGPALYAQAVQSLRRAVQVIGDQFGEMHPNTVAAMQDLAVALRKQGDLVGARDLQEKVLAVRKRALGSDHIDTLAAMNNLAQTLYVQGDRTAAHELQGNVLALSRRVLGEEHPNTLSSMQGFAVMLRARGDFPGARDLQEQVLAVRQRVLGSDHIDTLAAMNNLAQTLRDQGDLDEARGLQENVLAARRRVLGKEHPDTLAALHNLALLIRDQGDLSGARDLQEKALALFKRALGDEHPDTLIAMCNLALTLRQQGDLPGARDLQETAVELLRRALGDEHPDTLMAMCGLALTLRQQGDLSGARDLEEKALTPPKRAR